MLPTDSADLNLIKMCKLILLPVLYRENLVTDIMKQDDNFSKIDITDWYIDLSPLKDEIFINPEEEMFSLKIHYTLEDEHFNKSVRLKVPKLSYNYDKFKEYGFHEKQFLMFSKVLPEMRKLHDDDFLLTYHLGDETDHWMVLEDWHDLGYKPASRKEQLNFNHSKLVFQKLAKFHGLSVKLDQMSLIPDQFKKFGIDEEKPEDYENAITYFRQGIDFFIENLDPEMRAKYSTKLENMKEDMIGVLAEELRSNSSDFFKVLNQGHFSKFDTVFKYNEENVVENVKIRSFIHSHWRSPAFDILDFIVSSVRFEVFEERFDELLEEYIKNLNEILRSYNLSEYSIEDLRKDIDRQYTYGLWVCGMVLPLTVNPTDYVNFGPFLTRDHHKAENQPEVPVQYSTMADTYGNDKYRDLASKWFMYYVKRGVFES